VRGLPRATLVGGAARADLAGKEKRHDLHQPREGAAVASGGRSGELCWRCLALPERADRDLRHVAPAGVDQGVQVRIALMAARPAGQQDAHVAGAKRAPWRGQLMAIVAHCCARWSGPGGDQFGERLPDRHSAESRARGRGVGSALAPKHIGPIRSASMARSASIRGGAGVSRKT